MSNQYTRGPWGVERHMGQVYITDATGRSAVATVMAGRHDGEANVRLIRTAPELVEALLGMVEAHAVPSSSCKERPAYDAAIKALAKATGES